MHTEFALQRETYQAVEVTGGVLREEQNFSYILVEPGLACCVQITAIDDTQVQLLVLTQEQAYTCWKGQVAGQERLLLSNALVLFHEDGLELSWRGQQAANLAIYPPLKEGLAAPKGTLAETIEGFFTCYTLALPAYQVQPAIKHLSDEILSVSIPDALLDGVQDVFLCIDYLGDMGHAFLDGRLVSDHFFHGLPWEIGLKRFVLPEQERELIVRLSPLWPDAAAVRYFPAEIAFRPANNGAALLKINSITFLPEYQAVLVWRQ